MWRQSVPLGKAARATRRVCSGMGEGSCGCKDIGMLNAANQRGCSIFPQMQGIEFANSVSVGFTPILLTALPRRITPDRVLALHARYQQLRLLFAFSAMGNNERDVVLLLARLEQPNFLHNRR